MDSRDILVEAIEDGKIVKVPELYAKREGLPIVRRPHIGQVNEQAQPLPPSALANRLKIGEKKHVHDSPATHDNWKKQQVVSELLENFHWQIRLARRKKGLTRRQLSKMISQPEKDIMELESGNLPQNDFVLVNKIQQALNINLRKDRKDYTQTAQDMMQKTRKPLLERQREKYGFDKPTEANLYGSDIEILEDEI